MVYDLAMSMLSKAVLLLNASFEPICTISTKRAVNLVLEGKGEIISSREGIEVGSARTSLPWPTVVRLLKYVEVPRFRKANLTRKSILNRDGYICAYCGEKKPLKDMTMDHIMPRSRGGKHTWKNVIACCFPCNQRKDDRTPEEMGWALRFKPTIPEGSRRLVLISGYMHPDWEQWLSIAEG